MLALWLLDGEELETHCLSGWGSVVFQILPSGGRARQPDLGTWMPLVCSARPRAWGRCPQLSLALEKQSGHPP